MYPINSNKLIVTSKFGYRTYTYQGRKISGEHKGIDLCPSPTNNDAEILAFDDGVVTGVQKIGEQYGVGCYVRIKHDSGWNTLYYHLKSNSIVVNKGSKVKKGQKLGIIGTTGHSTGIHLHFQIDKGNRNTAIDPYDYVFNNKTFTKPNKSSFLPAKGYWGFGDTDKRVGQIASFMYKMFPAYTNKKALGNYFGKYIQASIKEFQKRTKLTVDGKVGNKTLNELKKYGFKE